MDIREFARLEAEGRKRRIQEEAFRWDWDNMQICNVFDDNDACFWFLNHEPNPTEFTCPICGSIHKINDCKTARIKAGEKKIRDEIVSVYYRARICKKCWYDKKRDVWHFYLYAFVIYIVVSLLFALSVYFETHSNVIKTFSHAFYVCFVYAFVPMMVLSLFLIDRNFHIDPKHASECNAIAPIKK